MTYVEKRIKKFLRDPKKCNYADMVAVLGHFGFTKIQAKGSHVKFKHSRLKSDLIVPVHNNECKDFYKVEARRRIRELIK
jgi:predicted RNA binding protein YcfA (HicA-like mRNA interferase family)